MQAVKLILNHKEGTMQYYAGQTVLLPAEDADFVVNAQAAQRVAGLSAVGPAPVVADVKIGTDTVQVHADESVTIKHE